MTAIPMLEAAAPRFGRLLATRRVGDFEFRLSEYSGSADVPAHRHPDAYFCYVVDGGIDEQAGGREGRFGPGSLHFHPSGDAHSGRIGRAGLHSLSIVARGAAAAERAAKLSPSRAAAAPATGLYVARCWNAFLLRDQASEITLEGAAHGLLLATCGPFPSGSGTATPAWVSKVRDHLHANFHSPVSLRDLAAIAEVHEVHVVRGFKRSMGVTPGVYIRRLRLDAARHALVATSDPIASIALDAGFYDQSHFTRAFHREIGAPPTAFRRLHSRNPHTPPPRGSGRPRPPRG